MRKTLQFGTVLRIGDVVEATGLTARAIRYYEELGLLQPTERRAGANRRFDPSDLERLRLVKRLREDIGLSLAEIRTYVEVEDVRTSLRSEYDATADPRVQASVLDRAEPVVRRRVAMLERKLALVTALRDEDEARLARISALRRGLASAAATPALPMELNGHAR